MTDNNYINENKTETFKKGDKVVMHTCVEASLPKYKGKQLTCQTDSFLSRGKEEVVFLEGFSGYFSTEFLLAVENIKDELLEEASKLVGHPATNISGSVDVACMEWREKYESIGKIKL